MGSDVQRVVMGMEIFKGDPGLRGEFNKREKIVRQVIRAVADLHQIGVVHADIHVGNVGLPSPDAQSMQKFLASVPLEHDVKRLDGRPTPDELPKRVTEPEYIGFGPEGHCKLFDFGYSFRPTPKSLWDESHFPFSVPLPPEILTVGDQTNLPFKVDSWQLGTFIYYLLTDGRRAFDHGLSESGYREQYDMVLEEIERDEDEFFLEIPDEYRHKYKRIVLGLLNLDPIKRLSVTELSRDTELMPDPVPFIDEIAR